MVSELRLRSIGEEIAIPKEFLDASLSHYPLLEEHFYLAEELSNRKTALQAFERLSKWIEDDPRGEKMFVFYLAAIALAKEEYRRRGIGLDVYLRTMEIFSSCMENCKLHEGEYKFDKAFWVYRQASLSLFRIGALDFELYEGEDATAVALHIPMGGDLSKEAVDKSFEAFDALARKAFPEFSDKSKTLYSWLMDSHVLALLPERSKIKQFVSRFEFINRHDDLDEVFNWVFHCSSDVDFHTLPEDTALQRKIKEELLKGNTSFGVGFGKLK